MCMLENRQIPIALSFNIIYNQISIQSRVFSYGCWAILNARPNGQSPFSSGLEGPKSKKMKTYLLPALMVLNLAPSICSAALLWDTEVPIPAASDAPLIEGVEFKMIEKYEPDVDGFRWLHGGTIVRHKDTWHVTWGRNPGSENTATEITQGRRSHDDFQSLTRVELIAPGTATDGHSHGATLSYKGELWGFFGRFTGFRGDLRTEAFKFNETSNKWESQGVVVADGFWAYTEPQRMKNGNFIMAGFRVGVENGNPPAVAISNGDDLTDWKLVAIPKDPNLKMWGESSVIVRGNRIINIVRADGSNPWAYVSISEDFGETWTQVERSNLPMVASKPYSGTLSTGQDYLIGTTTGDGGNARRPLTIALTDPGGEYFNQIYRIRDGVRTGEGTTTPADLAYPYAVEYDGHLYVVYSVGRPGNATNSLELAIVPLSSLAEPEPTSLPLLYSAGALLLFHRRLRSARGYVLTHVLDRNTIKPFRRSHA